MRRARVRAAAMLVAAVVCRGPVVRAADVLPAEAASKIVLKVLLYDTRLTQHAPNLTIGVMGSADDVAAFAKLKGQKLDNAKPFVVAEVVKIDSLPPPSPPDLLFVGAGGSAAVVSQYTRGAHLMSATNDPSLVPAGVAVGVGVDAGKPKVIINLTASDAEGMKWDPAVLKVAETVK